MLKISFTKYWLYWLNIGLHWLYRLNIGLIRLLPCDFNQYVCGEEGEGVMPHYVCAIFSFCDLMGCLPYWAPANILTYTSPPLYFYKKLCC